MTKPNRQFDATVQTTVPLEARNLIFSRLKADGQMVTAVLRNAVRFYVENPDELKQFYSDLPHLFNYDGRNDKKQTKMIQFKIERGLLNRLNALVKGNDQSKQTVIARLILYLLDHPDEMRKFYTKKD